MGMGMGRITLSVIVGGFPAELRSPRPLPGETWTELVIRNHLQEWLNLADRIRKERQLSDEAYSRLRAGHIPAAGDPAVRREIDRWMNLRLPRHGRTLQGLAELRDQMRGDLGQIWQLELADIICPRQRDPSGNTDFRRLAESLGAVTVEVAEAGPMDLGALIGYVHGDYLWILPGGTRLSATMIALIPVMLAFQGNERLALYHDGSYSMIYRTAALRALLAAGMTLSGDLGENARKLQEAGFELVADDAGLSLAELEPIYGGQVRRLPEGQPAGRGSPATRSPSGWRLRRRR